MPRFDGPIPSNGKVIKGQINIWMKRVGVLNFVKLSIFLRVSYPEWGEKGTVYHHCFSVFF